MDPTAERSQANFTNGDFETGDLSGWTKTTNLNPGLGAVPPTSIAQLNLTAGGNDLTSVQMGATPESVLASGLAAGDTLFYPRFGQYATVVNEGGNNRNSNRLQQSMTTTAADVDPIDSKIHVRFCLAPVLENPNHAANQQPYFYVEVTNTTQNKQLFTSFNFSGQSGVPWKNSVGGAVQYTDWQLFDLAPGNTDLAVGDTVRMDVIATGCSLGGHYGHLYVDGFGSSIPGLTVAGSAAATAMVNQNLLYTFQVGNGSTTDAANVMVTEVLPPGTTFVALTGLRAGASCTTPAVGASGTISCNFGTVAASSGTSFQLTVNIDGNASGPINNGNYTIQGTGVSPLIGPNIQTNLLYPITVAVPGGNGTISCTTPVQNGQSSVCTITPAMGYALNFLELDGANVRGAVVGNSYTIANVQAPHTLIGTFSQSAFTISTSVPGGNGTLSCQSPVVAGASSVCVITPAAGFMLSALTDNSTNVLGMVSGNNYTISNVTAAHTLQAAFAPASWAITSRVAGGNGTLSCTTPITNGNNSTCTITPAAGYALATLTLDGNDVMGSVSGNSYVITNVTAPHLVQATFAQALYVINVSVPGGNGTISCTSPVVNGASAVCALNPNTGYWLDTLMLDGTNVLAQVNGTSFTIANVMANHTLVGTFALASYVISSSVPGGNGTISCSTPVVRGGSASCTITPATGYGLTTLTLDGADVIGQISGNTYTVNNVLSSHLVQGTFSLTTNVVNVSVPAGNGTIVCTSPIVYGQSALCQITPAAGYRLLSVTLDGTDITGQVSGTGFGIASVTGPRNVVGVFELIPLYTVTTTVPGGNGTITCTSPVAEGLNSYCQITPAAGYELDSITLDGVDARIMVQGTAFNLYSLSGPHAIEGGFKKSRATACANNAECHSGFCADGVCCDRACGGQCEACNAAATAGTCTAVVSGAPIAGHPSCGYYMCGDNGCQVECNADSECLTGSVCSNHACIQGSHSLSGGGIAACNTTDRGGSSAAASGLLVLAALALLTRRRRELSAAQADSLR